MRPCSAFSGFESGGRHNFRIFTGGRSLPGLDAILFSLAPIRGPAFIYGPPTGLKLEKEKALNISSFHVEKIDGEWLIAHETTGLCCDYIRDSLHWG